MDPGVGGQRLVIGLTGGIGAGKSTFAGLLARRGAHVIDGDPIGREVIAPDGPGAEAVLERFGTLERPEIAAIVFADPSARRDLESISWPLIDAELQRRVDACPAGETVVLDLAVLAQGDLGKGIYGPVVTVEAPDEVRVARLIERGMSEVDARARMQAQATDATRRALADHVVVNDGDLDALDAEADRIWHALHSS